MRRALSRSVLGFAGLLLATGCAFGDGIAGAPPNPGPPGPPGTPPPTGTKWEGVEVDGACGRVALAWVLVDEVCGGTDDPNYMDYFHAPMFRDGAVVTTQAGDFMYAVDATHLWVLDVSDETAINRQSLTAGIGEPLSVASYQNKLLVAAGSQGLLLLDPSDPLDPSIEAQVALDGPALDVFVDGDTAFVATGEAGVAVVDLAATTPSLTKTMPVAGFVAGVVARQGTAYVAACDNFAVVDVASGTVRSQTWLADAYEQSFLRAPAKDVELVGDVAFVAAGRYGAVAIDVSDADNASLVGNCTEPSDMAFYASGVRSDGDQLFIAGGEWGIMPIDVSDPLAACNSAVLPTLPELPQQSDECSTEAPWSVVPWQDLFEPPPPGQDPIQTLSFGGKLYAFGDATRVGLRAIDVRDPLSPTLEKLGRYDEPRLVTGIAAANNRVFVMGDAGQVMVRDVTNLVHLIPQSQPAVAKSAVAVAMLGDGRWAAATQQHVVVEGGSPLPLAEPVFNNELAVRDNELLVPTSIGALAIDADSMAMTQLVTGKKAELPQAIASHADEVFLAAPEWTNAARAGIATGSALESHGVFAIDDIMDANLWRAGLPRRLLVSTSRGLAEIASLGGRAGLAIHASTVQSIALPPGTYVGATSQGDRLYLATADRGRYRSQLISVLLTTSGPVLASVEGFTGVASGVAVDGTRLYVGDADRGIRVYNSSPATPALLAVVSLQETP